MASSADEKRYEGQTDEAFPELFDVRAMPSQPQELKSGQLPVDQIRKYFEDVSRCFVYSLFYIACESVAFTLLLTIFKLQ